MGAARRDTVVPVLVLNHGEWEPEPPHACGWRHLGYLVLEGVLARDEELAGSTSTELVGPGELLQPWTEELDDALLPHRITWTVLEPARVGVLGPTFVASLRALARGDRRAARVARSARAPVPPRCTGSASSAGSTCACSRSSGTSRSAGAACRPTASCSRSASSTSRSAT